MPLKASGNDCSQSLVAPLYDGLNFDLNLPVIQPGEGPLRLREPLSSAIAKHTKLLLSSRCPLKPEERAAAKNHEPFVM